jgi:hypothetical protein
MIRRFAAGALRVVASGRWLAPTVAAVACGGAASGPPPAGGATPTPAASARHSPTATPAPTRAASPSPEPTPVASRGDALVYLAAAGGFEVAGVETDGRYVFTCGGAGLHVDDLTDPARPAPRGDVGPRCQHVALGPADAGGARTFHVLHHGDAWTGPASVRTFRMPPEGPAAETAATTFPELSLEGAVRHGAHLYVAARAAGLAVFDVAGVTPSLVRVVPGLRDARGIALAPGADVAYVADGDGGLAVVALADPAGAAVVGTIPTSGAAVDVDVYTSRIYVAAGTSVDVYDAGADAPEPRRVATLDAMGPAQAVAAGDGFVAVASWRQIALFDDAGTLVATEELRRPGGDRFVAAAASGRTVLAGEWDGVHVLAYSPGLRAPDLWVRDVSIDFEPERTAQRALVVVNRGLLPLSINATLDENANFSVLPINLELPPGEGDSLEVTFTPPEGRRDFAVTTRLRLTTNDPDAVHAAFELTVNARRAALLDVGDALDARFGFLDASGAGQPDALRGHVVVLAYFATW